MKMLPFFMLCCTGQIYAQQGFVVAGDTQPGIGGSVSYSIGQIDFSITNNNSNAGLQQVFFLGPFPLSALTFSANKLDTTVQLKWQTLSEVNTSYYLVERSLDGVQFNQTIGKVFSGGINFQNGSYSCIDFQPNDGVNYYRLKIIDNDGKFSYSAVIAVAFNSGIDIMVFPNPVSARLVLNIGTIADFSSRYLLYDISGKLLFSGSITQQKTTINTSTLKSGTYILKVTSNRKEASFQIIKQD